jgi:hypothetical protein
MALLEADDLTPFATIDADEAEAMVADAIALATLAAPCLGDVLTALQESQAKAVLRSAVLRWHESGSGATSQNVAGPFQQTVTPLARKSLFWPSEIDALRNICKSATSGGAFSVDTAATAMRTHSVLWGSYYPWDVPPADGSDPSGGIDGGTP